MTKFDDTFRKPIHFSNGEMILSGEYSKAEAAEIFSEYQEEKVSEDQIGNERVRFGFPPEHVEEREDLNVPCWYTGAGNGKGTKPVWTY